MRSLPWLAILTLVGTAAFAAPDKSGVKPSVLSLPTGAGSIEGLGESFEPQLNTGTSAYSVKLQAPPGVAGHAPEVSLAYNSGSGNGPIGIGWSCDLPRIQRQTDKGRPRYTGVTANPETEDTFLFGGEELVPLSDGTYRSENETQFTRFRRIPVEPGGPVVAWEATLRDGKRYVFGASPGERVTRAGGDPASFADTYCWCVSTFTDTSGNTVLYRYVSFAPESAGMLYPSEIEYAKFGAHYHRILFTYSGSQRFPQNRADVFSDFRPGFEVRTSKLLREVAMYTDGALVRRYVLGYESDPFLEPPGLEDVLLGFSLLHSVTQHDRSTGDTSYLPPLRFGYTRFHAGGADLGGRMAKLGFGGGAGIQGPGEGPRFLPVAGEDGFLADWPGAETEVCDINTDGLADFIVSGDGTWLAFLNRGRDRFTCAVHFSDTGPAQVNGISLDDSRNLQSVALADLDGDGMTDLVLKPDGEERILWHRNVNDVLKAASLAAAEHVAWGAEEVFSAQSFPDPIGDPALRMLDVDFDKRTDLLRPFDGGVEYLLNRPDGWVSVLVFHGADPLSAAAVLPGAYLPREADGPLPGDGWSLSDARFDQVVPSAQQVTFADMNGDRLQDWVTVNTNDGIRVSYWPNANGGNWKSKRFMVRIAAGGVHATDTRILDVNADGLSDIAVIEPRRLRFWINRGMDSFSAELSRDGAPEYEPSLTKVYIFDVNGNGTSDLFWDNGAFDGSFTYYEFVGSVKPNLLEVIDNGIGLRTTIEYKSSTEDYLAALEAGHPWTTKLPFPVQVVGRIRTNVGLDLNGDGAIDEYLTDLTYRDGYYDAFEREFRGFAYVERIERGDDYDRPGGALRPGTGFVSGPSLVTRHRFLTGSPDGADNDDYPSGYTGIRRTDEGSGSGAPFAPEVPELGGCEEESLKGKPVFVETIDPTALLAPPIEAASFHEAARKCALAARGGDPFAPAAQRCAPDKYVYRRAHTDWKVRRLYRPPAVLSPPGRFGALGAPAAITAKVGKSVTFAFAQTEETEVFEANGHLRGVLARDPIEYPARSGVTTRTVRDFDDYGNLLREANHGVVDGSNISLRDDERVKVTSFALEGEALARWIINRPAVERVEDERGVFVSEVHHHYDGSEMEGLPPRAVGARGLEKKTIAIVTQDSGALLPLTSHDPNRFGEDGSARGDRPGDPRPEVPRFIVTARTAHDSFGNAIVILDPLASLSDITLTSGPAGVESATANRSGNGHARILAYDPERHTYPVEERIVVGGGKDDLVVSATYDVGFGVMTSSRDFNGNVTEYRYDSFARLVKIIRPGDSATKPTQTFQYRPGDAQRGEVYFYDEGGSLLTGRPQVRPSPVASAVETRLREDAAADPGYNTFNAIQYISGKGQKLLQVEEGEDAGSWVVKAATLYNLRGAAAAVYQPYYRLDSSFHLPGVGGRLEGGVSLAPTDRRDSKQDAAGREIESLNPPEGTGQPGRTRVVTQYLPLEKIILDEEDVRAGGQHTSTPMVHLMDGLERLTEVHEVVQLDEAGVRTPGVYSRWVTRYDYDLQDNLVHILDSQGNEKWFRYDGLGRKIFMNDPDRGVMTYTYDAASNLAQSVDAKGQVIDYTYDGVNRLLTEDYRDDNSIEFRYGGGVDVVYHYDTPAGELDLGDTTRGMATNTKGFLAWVEDRTGEEHTSYDARGRVRWTVKRIPDPELEGRVLVPFKTEFTYDSLDRVRDVIYPDNDLVTNVYNPRSLLDGIVGGPSGHIISRLDYAPSGQIARCVYGNQVETTYNYDPRLRLSRLHTAPGGSPESPFIHYAYTFDGASNITRIDDRRPGSVAPKGDKRRNTQIFAYDDLYRLLRVDYSFALPGEATPSDGHESYRYDRIGNMLEKESDIEQFERGLSVTHLGTMAYGGGLGRKGRIGRATADPGPHALTGVQSGRQDPRYPDRAYPYDANGNMTYIDGLKCTWDFKDRLVGVENPEMRVEYRYDYADRRIWKNVFPKPKAGELRAAESTSVLYIDRYFEMRDYDAPTKYVWNGQTRVAHVVGSLSDRDRVQRLRVHAGWNLISVAVSTPAEQLLAGAQFLLVWVPGSAAFAAVREGEIVPAGTVLWLHARLDEGLTLRGPYVEPADRTFEPGGGFVSSAGLEVLPLIGDNAAVLPEVLLWLFAAREQGWRVRLPEALAAVADAPKLLAPGNAIFAKVDGAEAVKVPDAAGRVRYYHKDHLGSTTSSTGGTGSLLDETYFHPYGHPRSESAFSKANQYKFTQKELDAESRLQYFEARYLSGPLGRFVSVDPLLEQVPRTFRQNPQMLNGYSYSLNNPLIYADPTGEVPVLIPLLVKAGLGVLAAYKAYSIGSSLGTIAREGYKLHTGAYPGEESVVGNMPVSAEDKAVAAKNIYGAVEDLGLEVASPYFKVPGLKAKDLPRMTKSFSSPPGAGLPGFREGLRRAEKDLHLRQSALKGVNDVYGNVVTKGIHGGANYLRGSDGAAGQQSDYGPGAFHDGPGSGTQAPNDWNTPGTQLEFGADWVPAITAE